MASHVVKNIVANDIPNYHPPLIMGIWGEKGQVCPPTSFGRGWPIFISVRFLQTLPPEGLLQPPPCGAAAQLPAPFCCVQPRIFFKKVAKNVPK